MDTSTKRNWDPNRFFNVAQWGDGYFHVNDKGHMSVLPERRTDGPAIDIVEVIEEIKSQGIEFPAVIRFHDILRSKVKELNKAFQTAIEEYKYRGRYMGVFPVKVNQMREVVEEIVDAGAPYDYGLEAGSKPEIMAALAMNTNKNSLTILNGYKDADFMRLALLATRLGRKCIVVIENFSEVALLIKISRELKIKPLIGLRTKLFITGRGKWAASTGDSAKFGLTLPEIVTTIERFRAADMLDCVKLLHFHTGSQISDIRTIKEAIGEGARMFAKLIKAGVNLEYFDAGGGLAVDYDGSRSTADSSRNYRVSEYAADIVLTLKEVCDEEGVPHPHIVTESGRAISAYHSCVITNVVDIIKSQNENFDISKKTGEHRLVSNTREALESLNGDNAQECLNDARQFRDEAIQAFRLGILSLEERAKIEAVYWELVDRIADKIKTWESIPDDLADISLKNAQQYLCNFSVFQSTADAWAIDQVLPVMPIDRLDEEPTEECLLCDITCDSDGKIDQFISEQGVSSSIRLHPLRPDEPYYVGIFLTGAYQDVMGDMHNLFGRLNEVHVFCDDDDPSDFYIEEVIHGSNAGSVLSAMQYNPTYMAHVVKKEIDAKVVQGRLTPREGVKLVDFYENCLKSYTYLNTQN